MKLFQYLYTPFFVLSLLLFLFLDTNNNLLFYTLSALSFYPIISIIWKIYSNFDNNINLFIYDLISTLIISLLVFANLYKMNGILDPSGQITKEPIDMIYFSIVTWTTLGYGDFQPTESMRITASIEAMLGYIYNALFLGLCAGWLLIKYQTNLNNKTMK
ncbi:potassium channel family protein [Shewanella sp. YLB-07]|uniref:potassium channel family protein n=1 Tax=Shewanella sp. YLB-07 TaxID=2601268 RepID=UPI00128C5B28|nr:potassium channel family protein [Shewanella sp. YLB-07]MPY24296.1 two pore domain potassium channel family protein [Shewanella sp. YLB-07]